MKMKRLLLSLLIFSLGFQLGAEDQLWFFRGIEAVFNGVKGLDLPMSTQVERAYGQTNGSFGFSDNHFIVAQSQGGVRAMAYYKYLKERGQQSKIKGIITIGSPVRGLSYLSKGLNVLREDVLALLNPVAQAMAITLNGSEGWNITVPGRPDASQFEKLLYLLKVNNGALDPRYPENKELVEALDEASLFKLLYLSKDDTEKYYSNSSLKDMAPGAVPGSIGTPSSSKQTRRVWIGSFVGTPDTTNNPLMQFKPLNGGNLDFVASYYNSNYQTVYQVYETYSVDMVSPTYSQTNFFDNNIYAGYVVGTNNDYLSMVSAASGDKFSRGTLSNVKETVEMAFLIKAADLLRSSIYEFLSCNMSLSNQRFRMFETTIKACDILDDFNQLMNDKVIGTPSHDGLIAAEDQYHSDVFGGKRTFNNGAEYKKIMPQLHHVNEKFHPDLWGQPFAHPVTGQIIVPKMDNYGVGPGGVLHEGLQNQGTRKTVGRAPEY